MHSRISDSAHDPNLLHCSDDLKVINIMTVHLGSLSGEESVSPVILLYLLNLREMSWIGENFPSS